MNGFLSFYNAPTKLSSFPPFLIYGLNFGSNSVFVKQPFVMFHSLYVEQMNHSCCDKIHYVYYVSLVMRIRKIDFTKLKIEI